jgi:hypothetical protein
MKSHPGMRTTVKWGGPVLTILLVALWRYSGGHVVELFKWDGWSIDTSCGRLHFVALKGKAHRPIWLGWNAWRDHVNYRWDFEYESTPPAWTVYVPFWFPAAIVLFATGAAWHTDLRARRRARAGHCVICGYDRAGLAGGAACPECGTSIVALR